MTAAIAPVTIKVATVVPMIFPARPRLLMLAIDPAIEANTRGTTTQNIMLMNTVPKGLIVWPKSGANQPTIQPKTMPPNISARKAVPFPVLQWKKIAEPLPGVQELL